jgi:RNA polymerase sigma-70 factor (ECF subfamily)
VLLLHAWGELSHVEIAASLGIPQGTVASRLSRARLHLRTVLARQKDQHDAAIPPPEEP